MPGNHETTDSNALPQLNEGLTALYEGVISPASSGFLVTTSPVNSFRIIQKEATFQYEIAVLAPAIFHFRLRF